ncbi:MAG: glycosyltransferase [Flavitalea sp.]
MIQNEKIESIKQKPVILLSPLDWGLGHTTRCIPLISELIEQGCDVVIACNSAQKTLLELEFPTLRFVYLQGYDIEYASYPSLTKLKLLFNIGNILTRIKYEHSWFSDFFSKNTVDAVVSDNRYGLQNPLLPCILITHQLSIQTGSAKIINSFIRRLLYKWIIKFRECWIPDFESEPYMSGELGHPKKLPATRVKYIGGLSRLSVLPQTPIIYDVMVLLSGPEPQRTILENIILHQLDQTILRVIMVRGLPAGSEALKQNSNIHIINHASAKELNVLISQSSIIIARSGYTTIMDLLKLQKKMILVPTPGQPEQEYLGNYLYRKNMAVVIKQKHFLIKDALKKTETFTFNHLSKKMDDYKAVVHQFVSMLK